MAENEIKVHEVHLAATNAKIRDEPIVVITVRPDLPSSYRPHNTAISRTQAERILEDLKTLLSRSPVFLMLLALAGMVGCSADVEVETGTTSRPKAGDDVIFTDKTKTAASVDLLRDQRRVEMENGESVEMPFDGTMVVEGCIHIHEHLHIYLAEGDRNQAGR